MKVPPSGRIAVSLDELAHDARAIHCGGANFFRDTCSALAGLAISNSPESTTSPERVPFKSDEIASAKSQQAQDDQKQVLDPGAAHRATAGMEMAQHDLEAAMDVEDTSSANRRCGQSEGCRAEQSIRIPAIPNQKAEV